MDYIFAPRVSHNCMPEYPVLIKPIVTMDLAEKIAEHYAIRWWDQREESRIRSAVLQNPMETSQDPTFVIKM